MVSWPEDFANAVFDGTREDLAANPAEAPCSSQHSLPIVPSHPGPWQTGGDTEEETEGEGNEESASANCSHRKGEGEKGVEGGVWGCTHA